MLQDHQTSHDNHTKIPSKTTLRNTFASIDRKDARGLIIKFYLASVN